MKTLENIVVFVIGIIGAVLGLLVSIVIPAAVVRYLSGSSISFSACSVCFRRRA